MDKNLPDDDRTVMRPSPQAAPSYPATQQVEHVPSAAVAGSEGNALPIGTMLGEFELLEVIGEGGFGIVYLALDHSLQRRVAIKEYMPQTLAKRTQTTVDVRHQRNLESFQAGLNSFINEAKLLAQFDHPSLVKVHRFWKANGTAYMVMPLYNGPTFRDELKRRRAEGIPIEQGWLMELLDALTQAMAVMHAESCFHRDIAPDNILLLEGNGKPLLLDFGAARTVIGDMTQSLTVILKPGYAPIEQYAEVADMKQGAWTDVYALASSIHFAIRGTTPPPAVGRLVNDSFTPLASQPLPGYGHDFLAAIDDALKVRPAERTQSMDDFRFDLGLPPVSHAAAANSSYSTSFSDSTLQQATKRLNDAQAASRPAQTAPVAKSGNRATLLAIAGAIVMLGGALVYWQFGRSGASPNEAKGAVAPSAPIASPAPPPTAIPVSPPDAALAASSATPAPTVPPQEPVIKSEKMLMQDVVASQSVGFTVSASPARPAFRIDKDRLTFSVTSERDGFVHVLWLDADKNLTLLFPNVLADKVHIKAKQTLVLPPKQMPLVASKPEGNESFLVIVSPQPRDFSSLSSKVTDGFMQLNVQAAQAGGVAGKPALAGVAKQCNAEPCQEFGAAIFSIEVIP
jgi:serine/threonine protein kinase